MDIKSEKQLAFESVFEGRNRSVQLNVRISRKLNEALEAESERRNLPVSDLVRNAIAFALTPSYLRRKQEQGTGLDSNDQEVLEAYKDYLSELGEISSSIDEAQDEKIREVKRHVKGFNKMLEKAVERAVERALQNRNWKGKLNQ